MAGVPHSLVLTTLDGSALSGIPSWSHIVVMLVCSLGVGAVVSATVFGGTLRLQALRDQAETPLHADTMTLLANIANLPFICVGLTGTIILVQDNLARAFAMIAALALLRFRVQWSSSNLATTPLFVVVGGVACGLGAYALAWFFAGAYVVMMLVLVLVAEVLARRSDALPEPVAEEPVGFDRVKSVLF